MGFLCFLLFCIGACLVVFSGKRKQREAPGLILIVICFLTYGVFILSERAAIKAAHYPTLTGSVVAYEKKGNRGSSSEVVVRADSGRRYSVLVDATLPGIEPGDRVAFQYMEDTGHAREFQVLSGKAAGTFATDESWDFSAYLWLICGGIFSTVLVLRVVARKRKTAKP